MHKLRSAVGLLMWIGLLNLVACLSVNSYFGGDAINGKVVDGHYFVWGTRNPTGPKTYTEVSERVFAFSKWHNYSAGFTALFWIVGGIFLDETSSSKSSPPVRSGGHR